MVAAKSVGAAVAQLVAVDHGDDDVLEVHLGDGLGDAAWLLPVEREGASGGDGAEAATAGAGVAEDHEGGDAVAPAFGDVGAAGLFADGVQGFAAHEGLEAVVGFAGGDADAQPVGALFEGVGGDDGHARWSFAEI